MIIMFLAETTERMELLITELGKTGKGKFSVLGKKARSRALF